jgi:acyl-coenzyme A synthetase/AMP-(fatty) acid ligase
VSEIASHLLWRTVGRHLGGAAADAVAIRSERATISYRRLAAAVAYGAERWSRARLPRRVVLASRDQLHAGLGFLSLLAAGRVPLLADPTSCDAIRDMVARYDAALVTDERPLTSAGGGISLTETRSWIEAAPDVSSLEIPPVADRDEAFWVFTSGSTGEPKPVVHGHGAPAAAAAGFAREVLRLAPGDVTISTAGLPFVYALGNNLLFPLMAGASCILPEDLLLPTVLASLARHGATVLVAGPWSLEALARLDPVSERATPLRRLRLVLSAGEALPIRLFEEWKRRFGQEPIDNLGCTEMFNSFLSNVPGDTRAGTLGRVVPGYEIRVGDGAPAPGSRGALAVRGASRAIAIGADAVATTRDDADDEWYETGDEVAVNRDGRIVFLGRLDHRFKVKGRFVHPVEIERRLLEVEGVRECLVVPVTGERGLAVVAARIVADESIPESELRRRILLHARRTLEPFEMPGEITRVGSLPRSARGKLERPRG